MFFLRRQALATRGWQKCAFYSRVSPGLIVALEGIDLVLDNLFRTELRSRGEISDLSDPRDQGRGKYKQENCSE